MDDEESNNQAREDLAVAIHEAGHTIVGLALEWTVDEVSIDEDRAGRGHTYMNRKPEHGLPERLRQLVAGGQSIAEHNRRASDALLPGDAEDLFAIKLLFDEHDVEHSQRSALLKIASDEATEILGSDWRRVEALVRALLEARKLKADGVAEALGATNP